MRCSHGYPSGTRCKRISYGPANVTATPSSLLGWFIKIHIGLNFLVPAYPGCTGKEADKWVSVLSPRCIIKNYVTTQPRPLSFKMWHARPTQFSLFEVTVAVIYKHFTASTAHTICPLDGDILPTKNLRKTWQPILQIQQTSCLVSSWSQLIVTVNVLMSKCTISYVMLRIWIFHNFQFLT